MAKKSTLNAIDGHPDKANTLNITFTPCIVRQDCHKCTALLSTNPHDSHWISVQCNESIVFNVLCAIPKGNFSQSEQHQIQITPGLTFCGMNFITKNESCFKFEEHLSSTGYQTDKCATDKRKDISRFQFLFEAVSHTDFPPMFTTDLKCYITFERFYGKFDYSIHSISRTPTEGLHIIFGQSSNFYIIGGKLFLCPDGTYISVVSLCDGTNDCPGDEPIDERKCHCHSAEYKTVLCKYLHTNENKDDMLTFILYDLYRGVQNVHFRN